MNEWERRYLDGKVNGQPVGHFHHLINMHVVEAERTLEIGCGLGGNIPSLLDKPTEYFGIEGSQTAVTAVHQRWPNLRNNIVCGDFTKEIPFERDSFDLICERASIPHNDLPAIHRCMDMIFALLKPGGLFISSDWFSSAHSEVVRGREVSKGTRTDYPDGQFDGIGTVHFSDEAELLSIFRRFERIRLTENITRRPAPGFVEAPEDFRWISPEFAATEYRSAVWDIVVRKPQ